MISASDLVASLGRLTSGTRSAAPSTAIGTTPQAGRDGGPIADTLSAPIAEPVLTRPVEGSGDSLVGLAPPSRLLPEHAPLALPSVDDIRKTLDSAAQITLGAHASTAASASGGQALAHSALVQLPGIFGRIMRPAAPKLDIALSSQDLGRVANLLTDRLRSTPPLYSIVAGLHAADNIDESKAGAILSSAILNAAMIPGWPTRASPPVPSIAEETARVAAFDDLTEAQLLEFIAALGGDEPIRAQLASACDDSDRRRKLLRAATLLSVVIGAFLTALRSEVEEVLVDLGLLARGAAPDAWAGRIRLLIK